MRKYTPYFFPRDETRWWSAPARLRAATLAWLRCGGPHRGLSNDSWLRQPPAGIRA